MHRNICRYTHMLLKHLFLYFSPNKSVQHMHSRYIYIGKICSQNSKLKKKFAETECDTERLHSLSAYQGQLMVDDMINSGRSDFIWKLFFFGHELLYQLHLSLFLPLSFSPSLLLFLSQQHLPLLLAKRYSPVVFLIEVVTITVTIV